MATALAKQIVLAARPKGQPTAADFHLEETPVPALPAGGLLLRVLYLSLDPYMRGRMDDAKSYAKSVGVGEVMTSRPRPLVPRSACWRSEITCFRPAWVAVPFMMSSAEAIAGVLIALPEKM